jgi:serine/threonine protein kinase
MGVVYLAERPDLGSRVAIKVLRDAWLSPARRNRFAAEQRTLAQLNHPGIARLYDADTLADGTPWFVMEYVEGVPLTEYCAAHQRTIEQRLALFRAVCEAVQYAHEHGVIHRDLKPSNILVKPDGTVRLLDFGIARHLDSAESVDARARTTTLLMTPAYASPEQIRGERAGVQSDVYSLGVILYELLCGQLPFAFSRTTALAAVMATTHDPVRPSAAARAAAQAPSGSQLRTVAVLPFRNLGTDPDLEFLRLALPDEIATNLSYTRSLAVRPFATTSRYSDPDLDLRKVGREMRVSSVVTGEFSKRDDDLEVTLEAIDVADNRLLWRNTFQVAAGDMIGGRERVTAEIGRGLTAALGVPASAPRTASAPKSEDAYDLYLRSAGARYDPGAPNQEAIRILERALAIDSTYAPAWLALARRLYVRAQYETGDSATMAYSIAASQRARVRHRPLP